MTSVKLFKHVAKAINFDEGCIIFEEGEFGDVMYVVEAGTIEIRVGETVVEHVEAGGIFGEMALISDMPRSATAVALSDCTLIPFDQQKFKLHVQLTPMFSLEVMRAMASRMEAMNERLELA